MLKTKSILFFAVVISGFLISLGSTVQAVTVGPAKLEFNVDPGDTVTGQFFLMNEEQAERTYYSSFEKFSERNGERVYLGRERTELAYWITALDSVTLKPGEHRYIPFEINIPADAPPGGHYAVVWWSDASPDAKSESVNIITRVGSLLYVRVSGDIKEAATLSPIEENSSLFHFKMPVSLRLGVKNEGNVHLKPLGEIHISNIFGQKRAALPVNDKGKIILPNENATFDVSWKPRVAFGPYKASAFIKYGEPDANGERKQFTESQWIYVFPPAYIGITVAIILVLFVLVPLGIRTYNKWLINTFLKKNGTRRKSAKKQ